MQDDSSAVAMSRWFFHAAPGAIQETTEAVRVFAGDHGSQPPMLEGVTVAVAEALDQIFDAESTLSAAGGPDTVVDAAADGDWLSVRLRGLGRWPAFATETHLRDLADRVEMSVDAHGEVTVLFEFPSDPDRTNVSDRLDPIVANPASRSSSTARTVRCRSVPRRRRAPRRRAATPARRPR